LQPDGTLINGDVQKYWEKIGIPSDNFPHVIVNVLPGATFSATGNGTDENTLDIEIIGSLYPSSNLTIILFVAPNSLSGMYDVFNLAINGQTTVNNVRYSCDVINCSWGLTEIYAGRTFSSSLDTLFKTAVTKGINIFVASGDNGASDGRRGLNLNFPSSSPNVVSCGGTTLTCPTLSYSGAGTRETAWSSGGGGLSMFYKAPSYQNGLGKQYRSSPDIAMNADPHTGVAILLNNILYVYGGTSAVAPYMSALICGASISYFINTKLYYLPNSCFHDIISGYNGYYNAVVGYDNCAGLGSLDGTKTVNALLNFVNIASITPSINLINMFSNGTTQQINITVLPANATNKTILWTSSNNTIATVSSTGLITSRKNGSCTITAKTTDGTNKIVNISVNINNSPNSKKSTAKANVKTAKANVKTAKANVKTAKDNVKTDTTHLLIRAKQ